MICTRPGLPAYPSSATFRRAKGQQSSCCQDLGFSAKTSKKVCLDADWGFLKPNKVFATGVQATTMLAHLSVSLLLQALKNLLGCQNHGSPSTHSKVRICLFCKREPRKRHMRVPPAPSEALVEGVLLSLLPSASQGRRPQTRLLFWP